MSKLKKILLMALSLVLVAALSIGGTVAYLQDEKSDVNVMTLGNVKIEQHEYQRAEGVAYNAGEAGAGNGVKKGALVPFEQKQALYPSVPKNNAATDYSAEQTDLFYWGDYVYSGTAGNGLWNDNNLSNVMDKMVFVENTGKSDCYYRTVIAFECPEGMEYSEGSDKEFMMNVNGSTLYKWDKVGYTTIDGVRYLLEVATYQNALEPGDTAHPSLLQVVMTHNATNEDMELLGDTYEILVLSQAVQTEGFDDAATALDTAFGDVNETTAAEWFGDVIAEHSAETWDGTVDTSWYNDTDTEFTLTTAEQLAGFAKLVDDGNTFSSKTVKVGKDLDLAGLPFNPIGHSSNGKSFNGTFDGQGHTISNLYEQSDLNAWQYEGEYYGLFAYTNGATIKNVTIADAYISSGRNEAAGVVGNAVDTTFSDITISNTTLIAYNNSAGGVAAECYGNCSFTNITVDKDTVIGPLWGTYDVRLGGVVGMVQAGNNVTFKDITVACQLDAINDVAANYQYWLYRYSGMLIGHVDGVNGVADPSGYVTCENVKVIYGDWVNYHYCEFERLGAGSYNGPGEYKYARVEAGTGTDGIDLSTCNHDADESHNVLIVFDQLFGGGQGISGLKTYDGVTVVYPNN